MRQGAQTKHGTGKVAAVELEDVTQSASLQ